MHAWRDEGFSAFRKGTFGDGGANTYVSRSGHIQTINRFDLNGDGFFDLVLNNTHGLVEKLDARIFWGNGRDFDTRRSSPVPNNGAQWTAAGDLNGDGKTDLVVANYQNGTWDGMDSAVYWGGSGVGPGATPWSSNPFSSRTFLPTRAAQKAAIADLNRDGYPDIVFASSAGFWEYRARKFAANETPSYIYWGGPNGFSLERRTEIATLGASDVAVSDLNGDGWPDIVFANREDHGHFDIGSYVYFGSKEGFSSERRLALPTRQANAVCLADVNKDGRPDIAFANGLGSLSYVYLNGSNGFGPRRRMEIESTDARSIVIDDVDRDGWADILVTNHQHFGNYNTDSFLYFGGVNGYSSTRRVAFPVIGAWGAAIADLNGDGWKDIVVSGFEDHASFDTPSYIYWNGPRGFERNRRTPLMTSGAVGVTVADFNSDGMPDILICSTTSGSRGFDPIYIYWGNAAGQYTSAKRLALPAREAYESAAADLDDDGRVDLVVANMGEALRRQNELYIWWGQPGNLPFSPALLSGLAVQSTMGVSAADLDEDGYLDLVATNYDSLGDNGEGSYIYWGGPDGYVTTERTRLLTDGARAPAIADLNGDGHLEIIVGSDRTKRGAMIFWGDGTRNYSSAHRTIIDGTDQTSTANIADLNRDGYLDLILPRSQQDGVRQVKTLILWGNKAAEYSVKRASTLSTEATNNVAISDLNGDGWLDLVAPSYTTGSSRATLSSIFWGSSGGFSDRNRTQLPTNSASAAVISDFNHDGYKDVFFVCHRDEPDPNKPGSFGSHRTPSFLYWGGADGFRPSRRLDVPGLGAHNSLGVDPGNIRDRSFEFDYISAPHLCAARPIRLSWNASTPRGTSVRFQLRMGNSELSLARAVWRGPKGAGSYYLKPTTLSLGYDKWMQYRAVLVTNQGINSPILKCVKVEFE